MVINTNGNAPSLSRLEKPSYFLVSILGFLSICLPPLTFILFIYFSPTAPPFSSLFPFYLLFHQCSVWPYISSLFHYPSLLSFYLFLSTSFLLSSYPFSLHSHHLSPSPPLPPPTVPSPLCHKASDRTVPSSRRCRERMSRTHLTKRRAHRTSVEVKTSYYHIILK